MLNALRRKGEWRGDVPSVLVAFSAVGWAAGSPVPFCNCK